MQGTLRVMRRYKHELYTNFAAMELKSGWEDAHMYCVTIV